LGHPLLDLDRLDPGGALVVLARTVAPPAVDRSAPVGAEAMTFLCHCRQGFKAHGPIDKGCIERVVCHTETKRDCSVDCKPQPQAEYVRAQ